MALDQMQVFNEYIMPATIETLDQMIDKFNQASNGAIRLNTAGFDGDFMQESFFAAIHSAQRRVNRYGANGVIAATDLTELKMGSVKIAGGFGPIRYEPAQMTWLQRPTAEGIEVASRNFAEALLADQLNTSIAAAVAAIANQASAVNDVSGVGEIDYAAINGAHAKFGDHSTNIVADVIDGQTYHALIGQNIANATRLYSSQGVTVVDILNKAVVVTDALALDNRALGLTEGGIVVFDGSDIVTNISTENGNERIETTMQADYSFGLKLKGYAWDEANGGKSPSDAAIGTGTNWDLVASSIKHTAGVLAIGA